MAATTTRSSSCCRSRASETWSVPEMIDRRGGRETGGFALYEAPLPGKTHSAIRRPQHRSGVGMPTIHRALFFLLVAAFLAASFGSAEAQADRRTVNKVSQLILNSYKHLSEGNDVEAAREDCEKGQAIEEK